MINLQKIFFSYDLYNLNWERLEPGGIWTHISHKPGNG